MFNIFDDDKKEKDKYYIYDIFSKYHQNQFSKEILDKKIEDFEKTSRKKYFPSLTPEEKYIHADMNLKVQKNVTRTLNFFTKNLFFLIDNTKRYF